MNVGIIVALPSERKEVSKLMKDRKELSRGPFIYEEGSVGRNKIFLMQCGIGKVNAAAGTVEMINNFHPDCIISTGAAGGLSSSLSIMDGVAGEKVVYHDVWCGEGNDYGQVQNLPLYFPSDEVLYSCALSLSRGKIKGGLICSGDKFIMEGEESGDIKRRFPKGLAVDMESGAIAQVCFLYKLPFLSLRIISDVPGTEGRFKQYTDFWKEISEHSFRVTECFLKELPDRL